MVTVISGLLGGLALFIYGMQAMGTGLQNLAGNKMQKILEALTSVPIVGVLVGAVVTGIVQSSSLTTVMVVGFVNAGLLNLKQAISVIMGANIGTTVTAQLLVFNITDYYLPIIAVGFILYFFMKKKNIKNLGYVVFAFGVLLMGLTIMTSAMSPLKDYEGFQKAIVLFGQYKLLGLLIGLLMTVLIQSSSASIGILLAMASQGLVPFDTALPILLGQNIGTCITSVIAAIGTKLMAKRAAAAHVIFNVFGAVIFLIFMPFFQHFIVMISPAGDVAKAIANAHTSFNIINTIILLPFINVFTAFVMKILPGEEKIIKKGAIYLDWHMVDSPAIALQSAAKELVRMGKIAGANLDNAFKAFVLRDQSLIGEVNEMEEVVDELEREITKYLVKVSQAGMTEVFSSTHNALIQSANDIERVSDHACNVAEMAQASLDGDLFYSELAVNELTTMHELVSTNFKNAIEALGTVNKNLADTVIDNEPIIDDMEKSLRKSHIQRLTDGQCVTSSGVLFLDVISNFERVGDHSHNIAQAVKNDL